MFAWRCSSVCQERKRMRMRMPGMKTEMMRRLQELEEEELKERRGKSAWLLHQLFQILMKYQPDCSTFNLLWFFFQTCGDAEIVCDTCTKPIPIHVTC